VLIQEINTTYKGQWLAFHEERTVVFWVTMRHVAVINQKSAVLIYFAAEA
jgi:hypothetical protein